MLSIRKCPICKRYFDAEVGTPDIYCERCREEQEFFALLEDMQEEDSIPPEEEPVSPEIQLLDQNEVNAIFEQLGDIPAEVFGEEDEIGEKKKSPRSRMAEGAINMIDDFSVNGLKLRAPGRKGTD